MLDYRSILRAELNRRKILSPKYSLRDFAKDLEILPSHLCYLLKNKRGLSKESAYRVTKALDLRGMVGRHFRLLVSAKSGRSKSEKNLAQQALNREIKSEATLRLQGLTHTKNWTGQVEALFSRKPHFEYQFLIRRLYACGFR